MLNHIVVNDEVAAVRTEFRIEVNLGTAKRAGNGIVLFTIEFVEYIIVEFFLIVIS